MSNESRDELISFIAKHPYYTFDIASLEELSLNELHKLANSLVAKVRLIKEICQNDPKANKSELEQKTSEELAIIAASIGTSNPITV